MLVLPSLIIENGVCSHCINGEPGTEHLYMDLQKNPDRLIRLLRRENFKALHLIDKDSLFHDKPIDFELIKKITDSVDIPVELHADYKDLTDCRNAMESGLYRLVISNNIINNINLCKELIKEFSASRICFAAIIDNENADYNLEKSVEAITELIDKLIETGAKRVLIGTTESIFSDLNFEYEKFDKIFLNRKIRFTLYGGITNSTRLMEINLNKYNNIDSVILGKSLLTNTFPCQKIWRLIEAELEN